MNKPIAVLTKEGVAKLEAELEELKTVKRREIAEKIKSSVEKRDFLAFELAVKEYTDKNDERFTGDNSYCFLYTTGDNSDDLLDYIADSLAAMEDGEVALLTQYKEQYGCNVVMKYPIPEDAVTNTAYEDWFTDLVTRVKAKLFHEKCTPYMDRVTVDEKAFSALPSMKDIGANYYY